uniref:Fe2OG dioxygenase domain-containing protein n=1 Tax=Calcidiscus leptoporus TaxID=127549 RepID=A0A7S0JCX7_9EUKA|mmetsp:Transcript_51948/g.119506  ORF Transcript_51948/g.119506 Transcript_51948/m.119506 type:complete len:242 (+) Transcript_51948:354-1079(+)
MAIIELPSRRPTRSTTRMNTSPRAACAANRRAAAIAFLRLSQRDGSPQWQSERHQAAVARSLALALPKKMSTPKQVEALLSVDECSNLLQHVQQHAATHGWGSLHRKYPTVDLPVASLPCADEVRHAMASRALPRFSSFFGERYGPAESLVFRDLFVAKYEADGQAGLNGHVDASMLSLVLQLNPTTEFDGGGTFFEHTATLFRPAQGGAVFFIGKVFHAGAPITSGVRFVLVALVDRAPS